MRYILTFFAVLGLDLGTKQWAKKNLELGKKKEISKNNLYFWHVKNTGIAYNRFAGKKNLILQVTGAIIAVYSGFFLNHAFSETGNKKLALPLAIILAGAWGNFWERLRSGAVTDFIYIKRGKNAPIFNVADVAILFGAVLMGIFSLGSDE